MEHYYIITGNEYGADIHSKKNFEPSNFDEADNYFEKLKEEEQHECIVFVYVNKKGIETIVDKELNF